MPNLKRFNKGFWNVTIGLKRFLPSGAFVLFLGLGLIILGCQTTVKDQEFSNNELGPSSDTKLDDGLEDENSLGQLKTSNKIKNRQIFLADRGLYQGEIDGIDGPKTKKAIVDWLRNADFTAERHEGDLTGEQLAKLDKLARKHGQSLKANSAWQSNRNAENRVPHEKPTESRTANRRAPSIPEVQSEPKSYTANSGNLNVRNTPSINSPVIGNYEPGEKYTCRLSEGGWCKIQSDKFKDNFTNVGFDARITPKIIFFKEIDGKSTTYFFFPKQNIMRFYPLDYKPDWAFSIAGTNYYLKISVLSELEKAFLGSPRSSLAAAPSIAAVSLSTRKQESFDPDPDGNEGVTDPQPESTHRKYYVLLHRDEYQNYTYKSVKLSGIADRRNDNYGRLAFPNKQIQLISKYDKACDISVTLPSGAESPLTPLRLQPKCNIVKISSAYLLDWGKQIHGCRSINRSRPGEYTCVQTRKQDIAFFSDYPGWTKYTLDKDSPSVGLQKKHFTPVWPFKPNDPWLDNNKTSNSVCNQTPLYEAVSVQYCLSGLCRIGKISYSTKRKIRLPSLEDIGWGEKRLPKRVEVKFARKSAGNTFPKSKTVRWTLQHKQPPPDTLKSAMRFREFQKQELPIKVDFDLFPADPSAKFMLFDNLQACTQASKSSGPNWRPYHPDELSGLLAHKCSFAKLRKGERDLTNCARPKKDGKSWVYRPAGNQYSGKRIVVLVADSQNFNNLMGKNIRNDLIDWLGSLRKRGIKAPISVLTVEGDGSIRSLIRAEELSKIDIRGRIKGRLKFNGSGFRPLENLQDFEHKLQNNVARILYVTDASLRDEDDIRGADLGTPLNWKLSNVGFSVLTTGQCSFWTQTARAGKCDVITKKNSKKLFRELLAALES